MIVLLLLFSSVALAEQAYLLPDLNNPDSLKVEVRTRPPRGAVCRVSDQKALPSEYTIEIVVISPEGEVVSTRAWSNGATLAQNERIRCTLDDTAKQARINARKAAEAARQARQQKVRTLNDRFKTHCSEAGNYGELWNNDRVKWHKCNSFVWKALSNLVDELNENEFGN